MKPGRDEKVLAGWNGMMLRAFAEAAAALGRPDYSRVAERNAGFLLSALVADGRLLRTWKDGRAKLLGYLEDYAMVADGLLALHEATLDRRWLDDARRLAGAMVDLFWDPEAEGFFDTGTRSRGPRRPAPEPLRLRGSVRLVGGGRRPAPPGGADRGARTSSGAAVETIRSVVPLMARYPSGFGRFLGALDFHLGSPVEVALVWPAGAAPADRQPLALTRSSARYLPLRVVTGGAEGSGGDLPLLAGKGARAGRPTAYVCEGYACQAPTTEPAELGDQLDRRGGRPFSAATPAR